ncbi:ANTAR domain-containing protein [Aliiglaciecola sp. 3_MG-2023]|uniref:ANTAR domain-containing response regulator n=1 Tax=Aliiglaciecola sp. 3_MG-2023 TaxID=3062644 RepID=UPI0026E26C41|nr:ANTAR domain-containing protein [Aliiglaciecola sp. 3_MG-2023]MDO6695158.1 ANTAR domain-containing protein [Aliiglaciecola sp. 3_MG-2023]
MASIKNKQNLAQSAKNLRILLIDENTHRADLVTAALGDSRYEISHLASPSGTLLKQVDQLQPDIIVIDIESPSRDILESLHTIKNIDPKPVVMFSSEEDTDTINQSIESGVSAYVVGDLEPHRVKPILDAAVARFREFQKLKTELSDTKQQLNSRKNIDQAKRILMKNKNISEDQAFHTMRKTAMDTGQKLDDVAKTIISMFNSL